MPQTINIPVEGFNRLRDTNQTINFDEFSITFRENNCSILCTHQEGIFFLNKHKYDWILSLLEIFFKHPIIEERLKIRNDSSVNDFRILVDNFLFLKQRYDLSTKKWEYQKEIRPFLNSLAWFHKAHKVIDTDSTISFLSLITALDALNGEKKPKQAGKKFKDLIIKYNPLITQNKIQKLWDEYRCSIIHEGEELRGYDVGRYSLEHDFDFVPPRQGTGIFVDQNGNLTAQERVEMNQGIIGDLTYNGLYKIVSNCLIGYLLDYVVIKQQERPLQDSILSFFSNF